LAQLDESKALHFSEGKSAVDEIPPDFLLGLGEVFTYGGNKYTIKLSGEEAIVWIAKNCSCQIIPAEFVARMDVISQLSQEIYAEIVMRNGLEQTIQNMQKDKEKIEEDGRINRGTRSDSTDTEEKNTTLTKKTKSVKLNTTETDCTDHTESHWKNTKKYIQSSREDVQYVLNTANDWMLIMTILQERLEDYCVGRAISESVNSVILSKYCSLHINTCQAIARTSISGDTLVISGRNNWLNGNEWHEFIGSATRHFLKWQNGESYDDESGKHHLLHAAWNILVLWFYEQHKLGTDDRLCTILNEKHDSVQPKYDLVLLDQAILEGDWHKIHDLYERLKSLLKKDGLI